MTIQTSRRLTGVAAAVLALCAMPASGGGPSGAFDVLYSFTGDPDAEYPSTDLVIDGEGNLYGMSVLGGDFGSGTVFRLSPSADGWIETVLYSFTSVADGGQPYGGVTLDDEGNLYGTAVVGGTGGTCVEAGCGVVWKLSHSGESWSQEVIYNFTGGDDGYGPGGPVVFDSLGNLYGMTPTGGEFGLGVIYQLSPDGKGEWTQTVLHAFTGGEDGGSGSAGRLLIDEGGNILGVATTGGAHKAGTIFRLSPGPRGTWTLKTLYSFEGEPDGVFPYGGLARDKFGNLYGTTYYGGEHGDGTVYKLAYNNGRWHQSVLYSFTGGADGAYPIGGLVFDSAGNLYGTTSEDGAAGCNCGTIFRVSTPTGTGQATVSVVHQFHGPDGAYAYTGLARDAAGNFYGTTVIGGTDDDGVIYKYRP